MQTVLFATNESEKRQSARLIGDLRVNYLVCVVDINGTTDCIYHAVRTQLGGRPPAALVADIRHAADCLPIRHIQRALKALWDEDAPPPLCLALMDSSHLAQPDWPAYADDFLLAPFDGTEAVARLRRLFFTRRHVQFDDTLTVLGVNVDFGARRVTSLEGKSINLTPREFDLFGFLVQHRGRFFSRERLLDLVWGVDFEGGWRTVDIHIRRLRAKLPASVVAHMETRRGVGYALVVDEHTVK